MTVLMVAKPSDQSSSTQSFDKSRRPRDPREAKTDSWAVAEYTDSPRLWEGGRWLAELKKGQTARIGIEG